MKKKWSTWASIMLVVVAAVIADPVLVREWNWTDDTGKLHEYSVIEDVGCSWYTAGSDVTEGWNLATVTSAKEQQSLIFGLAELTGEYWLGGYQVEKGVAAEDDWAWVTGESWEYKNWAPGEPNDAYGNNTEQHMAVWSKWGTSDWLWNDEAHLPNISGYVVERTQSVPEPEPVVLFAIGLVALMILRKKAA